MKIIVAAVPGAGKSTILSYVKKKMPKVNIATMGDLVLSVAKREFGIKDRDELRSKLNLKQQKYVQERAAEEIARLESKILLIDTHLSIKTPEGYFPGLSEKIVRMIKPDLIVVLEFRPSDVIKRRVEDETRKRDVETEAEVEMHQRVNREFAVVAASAAEASVEIINLRYPEKEPYEHAMDAANKLIELIKKFEQHD